MSDNVINESNHVVGTASLNLVNREIVISPNDSSSDERIDLINKGANGSYILVKVCTNYKRKTTIKN